MFSKSFLNHAFLWSCFRFIQFSQKISFARSEFISVSTNSKAIKTKIQNLLFQLKNIINKNNKKTSRLLASQIKSYFIKNFDYFSHLHDPSTARSPTKGKKYPRRVHCKLLQFFWVIPRRMEKNERIKQGKRKEVVCCWDRKRNLS